MKEPSPTQGQLIRLLTFFKNGQLIDAEKLAKVFTQEYPKHQFAWKVLGATSEKLGRKKESLFANKKAADLTPNDHEAHNNLGNSYRKLGLLEEAIGSYNRAISIKTDYPEVFYNLANTFTDLGQFDEARSNYNKAIILNASYFKAYNNLGFLLAKIKNLDEAIESFKKAIEIKTDYLEAHHNLGNALRELGRLEEAIGSYNKAINIKADYSEVHNDLGIALKEIGRPIEAMTSFNRAIEIKQDHGSAYNNLGVTLEQLGKFEESEKNYRKAIFINPDFAEAYNNLGICLKSLGQLSDARENFIKAIELKPDYGNAHYNLTELTKFQTKDEHFTKLQNLFLDENLSENNLCYINFSLAKAFNDLQNYEQAFSHYLKGNELRKKNLKYNLNDDLELFEQIKKNSGLIFQNSLNMDNMDKSLIPIFIVGMPRSGTTLIEQIISAHSQITGAGELLFISQYGERLVKGSIEINKNSVLDFRKNYFNKLKNVSKGKSIVVDKLPHNFRYIGLIAAAFPEAKILHIKRNPSAVCWANFKQYFSNTGLGYSYSLKDTVSYYNLYLNLMKHWKEFLNQRIYDIDYELLVESQEIETHKIIEHLELNWDPNCLMPENNTKGVATASSIQVRKKVYKGSSQEWQKYQEFLNGAFDVFSKI